MELTFNQWACVANAHVARLESLKMELTKLTKRGHTEKIKLLLNSLGFYRLHDMQNLHHELRQFERMVKPLIENPFLSVQALENIIEAEGLKTTKHE